MGDRPLDPGFYGPRPGLARPAARPHDDADPLDADDDAFFRWLCATRGLEVSRYRAGVIRRRRSACLRVARAKSVAEARTALETNPAAAGRVLSALLIGVTSFFRDQSVFEALRSRLAATPRRPGFRVLSVACSDGSELYSVAMLLDDLGMLDGAHLIGIDCRPAAIAAARSGVYPASAAAALDAGLFARHLTPHPRGARIAPRLHAACRWEVGDAFTSAAVADSDLILCRNLAIYLNHASAGQLWDRLAAALRPGGLLVTGKAERPPAATGLVRVGPCLYKKREVPA